MPPAHSPPGTHQPSRLKSPKNSVPSELPRPLCVPEGSGASCPPAIPWPRSIFTTLTFRGRTAWSAGRSRQSGGAGPPTAAPSAVPACQPVPSRTARMGWAGWSPVSPCPQLPDVILGCHRSSVLPWGGGTAAAGGQHRLDAMTRLPLPASPSLQIWLVSIETRFWRGKVNF